LSATTAERIWAYLSDAIPGSDAQLQLLAAYASLACTGEQADRVEALLNDALHLEGLPIDTELTWDLVTTLAACGRADDTTIDTYLGKDDTAAGQRRAAGARAAIGTLDAKWRAWNAIAHPQGAPMTNALMYEAARGLSRANDPALMAPLVDDYFASLRSFFEGNSLFVALRATQYSFPTYLAGRVLDLPERIDAWLTANRDAPAVLIKVVTEGGDHVRRALAAQARSAEA
jgi:aminopeptidase N